MKPSIETVTPAIAASLLKGNTKNRKLNKYRVQAWAEAMQNGEWKINGDALCFALNGKLLNGQHRLQAVIESGTTQDFLILRDVDEETMKTMDIGKKRSSADTLEIFGYKSVNQNVFGAAVNIILDFETNSYGRHASRTPSPSQVVDCAARHPQMIAAIDNACHRTSQIQKFAPMSIMAACYYMFSQMNPVKADMFLRGLIEGASLRSDDPVLALRNRLVFDQTAAKRAGDHRRRFIALFVRSWIAFLNNESLTELKYRSDSPIELNWNKSTITKKNGKKAA